MIKNKTLDIKINFKIYLKTVGKMTEISRYIWYKLELGLVGPSPSPMNDGIILGFGPKGYKPN